MKKEEDLKLKGGFRGGGWTLVKDIWIGQITEFTEPRPVKVLFPSTENVFYENRDFEKAEFTECLFSNDLKKYKGYYWRFVRQVSGDKGVVEIIKPDLVQEVGGRFYLKDLKEKEGVE